MAIAAIDFKAGSPNEFDPKVVGLIINESFKGCGLVVDLAKPPQTADLLKIKVGEIGPLQARVAWVRHLEDHIYRVGVEFLE